MDRRVIRTKEAIQNAYQELLYEKDATKITISEIARRANIDRKTFYLHYESINDVMRDIIANKLQIFTTFWDKEYIFAHPFDAKAFFKCVTETLKQDEKLLQHPKALSSTQLFWQEVKKILAEEIASILSDVAYVSQEEALIYARFFASGVIEVYTAWLKDELSMTLDEIGELSSTIILDMAKSLELKNTQKRP